MPPANASVATPSATSPAWPMNSSFNFLRLRRMTPMMDTSRSLFLRSRRIVAVALVTLWLAGCDHGDTVRVKLHVRPASSGALSRLEVQAQVAGPQSGLRYKWFSVSGGCDPQESDFPSTLFQFAENVTRDRV